MRTSYPRASLLMGVLAAIVMAGSHAADEEDYQLSSLALSGGASKGAYEAGMTWAAVKISRWGLEPSDEVIQDDVRPFKVNSIAGTSAGGINAVLAALSWCVRGEEQGGFPNRIDENVFRDTWLPPDINNLLPPEPEVPPYRSDDASLSRRTLVEVAENLRDKWRQPGTFRDGCSVPVGVTVTRTVPAILSIEDIDVSNQRFFIPFELRVKADGALAFKFDPDDYPRLSDPSMILMPWAPGAPEYSLTDDQVLNAIFATSAFPLGFGRRQIPHCRLSEFVSPNAVKSPLSADEYICPPGYEPDLAVFADGGLFDNLPLALARKLAELRVRADRDPLPVSYIYLEPNRFRFDLPAPEPDTACEQANPPGACGELDYSFSSETQVLAGSLGTARKYALYEELTSDTWRLSLPDLSQRLAAIVAAAESKVECGFLQGFFEGDIDCSEALVRAGRLLILAYDYRKVPITPPVSRNRLVDSGMADQCEERTKTDSMTVTARCRIDIPDYRRKLATVMIDIATDAGPDGTELIPAIERSARSIRNDRSIVVTSLGGPITGQLLGAFGAFLEYKFREYDYYAGIYDAVIVASNRECGLRSSKITQSADYDACLDEISERVYNYLSVGDDTKGRYVFARLAQSEFGEQGRLRFAYAPLPAEDRDMRIIHEALQTVVRQDGDVVKNMGDDIFVERTFFEYLRDENFTPTPTPWGGEPLLSQIIDDPDSWTYELTKRWTTRLVYLERQAEVLYEEQEPDPEKRENAQTGLLGAAAWGLQTTTYRYPKFAFAPSTAPESYLWRSFIPYEVGLDLIEGDLNAYWQPTWNVGGRANLGIRFGLGFAGGLFKSTESAGRDNYGTAGFDVTFLSKSTWVSSYGFTPAVFHNWGNIQMTDRTSLGIDVHVGFLNNRLRASFGTRDASEIGDTLFLTISIADLPGMIYWLTR